MSLKNQIDPNRLPVHIAVIMDGNGRWAKKHGKDRIYGHQQGVNAVRETVEACAELGVPYLTLYAFSTENWDRPGDEVTALMELLVATIHNETAKLNENNIRLTAIGNLQSLPPHCLSELQDAMRRTEKNTRLNLVLALSYSSRWEIVHAVKALAEDVQKGKLNSGGINEEVFSGYLTTSGIPDPELLIRTSNEYRISNFLLWQSAYAELYFTPTMWPDFNREELYKAILDYQKRERRFGKISEQLEAK